MSMEAFFYIIPLLYLLAGIVQWLLLRRYFKLSWLLIFANLISFACAFVIVGFIGFYFFPEENPPNATAILVFGFWIFISFGFVHAVIYCFLKKRQGA